ncbi:MAG: ATP-binding cassette domain-containing protein, partial [Anaerolineae bacterium]|nr:ATP-binding cassette domain-containing protein [Anaerolineae bacterium]
MRLELRHISKTFGPLKANNDISHTFQEGHIYAVLGENGAGKSTLMKIISGYQQPDTGGEILIDGNPMTIHSPSDALRNGIGMLYQDPLDFPPMTVLENYLTAHPKTGFLPPHAEARTELLAIARRFGFNLDPEMLIEGLTIGERQQLEIVRLLSLNIGFLILDEPTTGISEEQRQILFSTLKQLAREDKLTIALVTHKLADVEELCDQVLVLRHGKVTGTCAMPVLPAELVKMMFGHSEGTEQSRSHTARMLHQEQPVLQVKDLTLQTRLLTIGNIQLNVHEGEVIGLAGLEGSGQSDFMRFCAGLNRVSSRDHLTSGIAFAGLLILFHYLMSDSTTVFT